MATISLEDIIAADLRRVAEAEQQRQRAGRGYTGNLAGRALQGLAMGWGDELVAGARTGGGMWGDYREALAEERAAGAEYSRQNPGRAMAAELAGGVASLAIPGLGVLGTGARVAGSGGRVAQAVRTGIGAGAVQGAVQGAGDAEGGVGSTAMGAAGGGATGAALGGVVGAAMPAVGGAARAGVDWFGRLTDTGAQRGARDQLAAMVQRDVPGGVPAARQVVGSAADEAVAARRAGMPDQGRTLAEITGPNATASLDALAQMPGDAMATIERGLRARGGQQRLERIDDALTATFGGTNAMARREALLARRSEDARPLYDAALGGRTTVDPADVALLQRAPAEALRDARKIARMRDNRDLSFRLEAAGGGGEDMVVRATTPIPLSDIHYLKTGLDNVIASNIVAGRPNALAVSAMQLRDEVVDRLDTLTHDGQRSLYAAAREAWAGPSAALAAMNLGRSVLTMHPAELSQHVARMSPIEREHLVIGATDHLRSLIARSGDRGSANPVRLIANSPAQRQALETVIGATASNPQQAQERTTRLLNYLGHESDMARVEQTVLGNSRTAQRQAFMRELAPTLAGAVGGGTLGWVTDPGAVAGAAGGAALAGGSRYLARTGRERVTDALGRMLGATDPIEQRRVMDALAAHRAAAEAAQRAPVMGVPQVAGMAGRVVAPSDEDRRLRRGGLLD